MEYIAAPYVQANARMREFDRECFVQEPKPTVTPPAKTGLIGHTSAKGAGSA